MGNYVDGFVLPVPKANLEAYRRMAEDAGKVWREYGALAYTECVADDVKPGELTSFPQSVKLEPDETVVFADLHPGQRAPFCGDEIAHPGQRLLVSKMPLARDQPLVVGYDLVLHVRPPSI
jgi:uncharacterized protein YbaA (DUF1428 family)